MGSAPPNMPSPAAPPPGWAALFRVFGRIGVLSFGGPAAQIALMHKVLVDEKAWLGERDFMNALGFCMLLPGPEAMQIATYAGWRLRGVRGGLIAGLLFVLPGAAVMLGLALLYALWGQLPLWAALFTGVKAAALIIVIQALLRIGRKVLLGVEYWALAVMAFVAIFALAVPFPLIVLMAGLWGFVRGGADDGAVPARIVTSPGRTLKTVAVWLMIWAAPFGLIALAGGNRFLVDLGLFFSRLAVVTFGGAYAVLAYMAQDVVARYGWISAGQMLDGLGLAETTPGPLILVTEFVGFVAGHGQGGVAMALIAALLTLWVTFVPCFLWIFTGAPYIGWISAQPRLARALRAISAAVVGVIANLSIWFGLNVLFARIEVLGLGPVRLMIPDVSSTDPATLIMLVLVAALIFWRNWGFGRVLLVAAPLAVLVDAMI